MKKRILLLVGLTASLLLLCNTLTVSAGVEPTPWQREINNLHSVELNVAAIDKRIGKLLDSPASPKGLTGQLEAMANKLGNLDIRLADVLNILPPSNSPYDGLDEVLSALEGIRSDSGSIVDFATRMGVEPAPWQPAALYVKNNAQTLINRIDGYTCPIGTDCTPSSEPCTTFTGTLGFADRTIYYDLGSVSRAVITGELSCSDNHDDFDLYLEVQNSNGIWSTVASSLGVTCTESVSYDVGAGHYDGRHFRWRVYRYAGPLGWYSLLSCIYR